MAENKDAMDGLLGKIYGIMSAPDNVNANPQGRKFSSSSQKPFISFCSPGFPLDNLDFGDLTTLDQVRRCSYFSQFINSIPAPSTTWQLTSDKVWDVYELALTQVKLPRADLSDTEEKMLKKAEKFLTEEVVVTDPFTDEKKKDVRATLPAQQYEKMFAAYTAAVRRMNNARITAITNPTPENVAEWTNNGPIYQREVDQAYSKWGSVGYRDYVNQAQGIIANLTARGSFALYDRLRSQFQSSARTDMLGGTFYPTVAYPPKVNSPEFNDAWTKFTFSHREVHEFREAETKSWGGGVGVSFGLWSFGGSASHSETRTYQRADVSGFELKVDLIQVPILRNWMSSWIFSSRGWKGTGPLVDEGSISSGEYPLSGLMCVLPTSMIVARNVELAANMESTENRTFKSQTNASASVGWGPFSLRGNYSRTYENASHDYVSNSNGLMCKGAQIIGFICDVLPRSPFPSPNLKWTDQKRLLGEMVASDELEEFEENMKYSAWLNS